MSERKRIRGKNFSEREEHVLIDLVLSKKDILQDKKKDSKTWQRKAACWEQLAKDFQAQTGTQRTCSTLREKYDNMKKNSRNKYRGVKNWDKERESSAAENSWCSRTSVSESRDRRLVNNTTPLENQFDSDGNFQLINVAKEENPSISSQNSDTSQLLHFFKENIDDIEEQETDSFEASQGWMAKRLRDSGSPQDNQTVHSEIEQIELFKLQQQYYIDQNSRAAEKHKYEVEKQIVELQTARLKNQLLEMEIELKRVELAKIRQSTLS
ncbi:uncharacterized protein [Drosophila takahashii]|uniref:uncharacterized protein isoform X1 n=1 Tax=Drosophila takahashii TaxID=29030 RepID=UPI0038993474